MKYRIIGAVACICILLVSVLNYPVLLTGRMESRRYHQHREATPKAVCAVHAEKEFCTHLPLIVIDTGGAEIPGRGLVDEEDRHMGFTSLWLSRCNQEKKGKAQSRRNRRLCQEMFVE